MDYELTPFIPYVLLCLLKPRRHKGVPSHLQTMRMNKELVRVCVTRFHSSQAAVVVLHSALCTPNARNPLGWLLSLTRRSLTPPWTCKPGSRLLGDPHALAPLWRSKHCTTLLP